MPITTTTSGKPRWKTCVEYWSALLIRDRDGNWTFSFQVESRRSVQYSWSAFDLQRASDSAEVMWRPMEFGSHRNQTLHHQQGRRGFTACSCSSTGYRTRLTDIEASTTSSTSRWRRLAEYIPPV